MILSLCFSLLVSFSFGWRLWLDVRGKRIIEIILVDSMPDRVMDGVSLDQIVGVRAEHSDVTAVDLMVGPD